MKITITKNKNLVSFASLELGQTFKWHDKYYIKTGGMGEALCLPHNIGFKITHVDFDDLEAKTLRCVEASITVNHD